MNEEIDPEEVENRKNELNLRPALLFVQRHLTIYQVAIQKFKTFNPSGKVLEFSFLNEEALENTGPQVDPPHIRNILSQLPNIFLELSKLKAVDFGYAGIVPVPIFENDGSWKDVEMVSAAKFPRPEDHPSRILIGYSSGNTIFPTALPESVFVGAHPRMMYQIHVFLHEFFHTIESPRREAVQRAIVILVRNGKRSTFLEWWMKWEELFLQRCPIFPTRYASNYHRDLTYAMRTNDYPKFTHALAEQVCECFVGYILGIVPNGDGEPDFKSHCPAAWELMHELATSELLK